MKILLLILTVPWFTFSADAGPILGFPPWAFYSVLMTLLYALVHLFFIHRFWDLSGADGAAPQLAVGRVMFGTAGELLMALASVAATLGSLTIAFTAMPRVLLSSRLPMGWAHTVEPSLPDSFAMNTSLLPACGILVSLMLVSA